MSSTLHFLLASPQATQALGRLVGSWAQPGSLFLLEGNLGSGKTTLVQGIAAGLGIPGVINSPTFVLIQEYWEGRIPLFHCDLYRLSQVVAEDLGLPELWQGQGITVIEWPERLVNLPDQGYKFEFAVLSEEERSLTITAQGDPNPSLWFCLEHFQPPRNGN
ncbi:MAG: tRNA (adenosine(37)-N6)-threonylcarbamoyltransferase complex ATPase subunit type 1 TsaE [Cyanobacteriota bacterium]|nr:tRNA (adenosine(37)-N6)-threonylcarbamoyltransferase complex ATPase subunit type 1 TsaE [Cyanobacteriota bacterium]